MPSQSKYLVVIPAWNEEGSVGEVVNQVKLLGNRFDVLVVDDGSTDKTSENAHNAGAYVINLPFNLGVGGAMRTGFVYARERGYAAAIQVDADGQHDPQAIPRLTPLLGGADIVIGSRFAGTGNYHVSGPRKWAMKWLSVVISRIARTRLTDTTSGFKAMGPRALELFSNNYPAEYLGDTVEALVIASQNGLRITEVPVEMRNRQAGIASANPLKSTIYLLRASLALAFAMSKKAPRKQVNRGEES